jgi:UDP-N-acetylglucosamine--N-acetylmuramyl-(pentapeptide) pyrophosphoryl-undecaprenol N-acetylglucosamine transferase
MLREADLTPDALWDALTRILADGQAAAMRDAARRIATPNAVADLYQLVLEAKDQGAKQ